MPAYAPERGQQAESLIAMINDYTQLSDSTAETIIVPDHSIGANVLDLNRTYRGLVKGVCSNVVTTPGTLTYRVRLGPTTLSATAVIASNALGLDTTARTGFPFQLEFTLCVRSTGASGTIMMLGQVRQSNVLASTAANLLPQFLPASSIAVQNVDTTVANILSVSAQFSVATDPTNLTANAYFLDLVRN